MKNKTCHLIITVISLFILYSCEDFIETDLKQKSIAVLAPANNTVSPSFSQTFWWQDLKGAVMYNLQIVKPDFSSVQQFILDTTVEANQFSYSLLPGSYQWRIRGLNNSSYTAYTIYNITIDSTLNLSNQWVALASPADNYASKNYTHTFTWQPMTNANTYLFQVVIGGSAIYTQTLTATTANYTFNTDGSYQWRVLAQNNGSTSSSVNATRTINIDNTPPTTPVLTLPVINDTVSNPVTLTWTRDISAIMDSVFVYTDTNLTVLVIASLTTSENLNFNGTIGQDYFWRVRSGDAVGNWSTYSTRRKFIIVP